VVGEEAAAVDQFELEGAPEAFHVSGQSKGTMLCIWLVV
jgi:hypothetical protein